MNVYLTGVSNNATRAIGRNRADLGVLVTPLRPHYADHIADYKSFAVDNGAFSTAKPFDPAAFRALVGNPAIKAAADRCLFAAVPDVVGDARATRESWNAWWPELRGSGLPLAFVLQDGAEADPELIPWGELDVLFVGGSTDWKIGARAGRAWMDIFRRADAEAVPVHMGRVNSFERCEIAFYGLGCRSADGTHIAYNPRENTRNIVKWLNIFNNSAIL